MADDMRIGFIGCGLIAASHARGIAQVPDVQIGPVHDLDSSRAEVFAATAGPAAVVVSTADEVIANSDAVYVCTWTAAHPEAVLATAEAGKPVFCEKPLAIDQASVEAMSVAVATAGVVNQVGLVLRHSPSFRWLESQLRSERGGPLMNVVFRNDQYLPTQGLYRSSWRADRTKAGAGALLEHSIHDLDLISWMMGPIRSVNAHLGLFHQLDGIDDVAAVLLVAESGASATLSSVWHDVLSRPSQRRVEVFCREMVYTLSGDWNGPVSAEDPSGYISALDGSALRQAATAGDGRGTNPDADFIEAIRSARRAYPDFALAAQAHRLADAAYRSAADDGRPVSP